MRAVLPIAFALLLTVLGCGGSSVSGDDQGGRRELLVATASSLRNVMPELERAFEAAGGPDLVINYGSSGVLRRQVQGGAPVDVVVFASPVEVDDLIGRGLLNQDSRTVLAFNDLVLITPAGGPEDVSFRTLGELSDDALIGIGDPSSVPAGRYGKEALTQLGTWDQLEGRAVFAGNVGVALAYARRGEVAASIVYATDAQGIDDVVVVDRATWEGAPTPTVVAAASASGGAAAIEFLKFLSTEGAPILQSHGFRLP